MKLKLNGAIHTALRHLETVTDIKGSALARKVKEVTRSLDLAKFEYNTLQYMVEQEWVLKEGDNYSLASAGRLELAISKDRETVAEISDKVKHKLHTADRKSTYLGESMICPTYREGAFDYTKCMSIINQKPQPYHIKAD